MEELKFTWDKRKESTNIKKHKVSFEEAKTVFSDEFSRLIHDSEHSLEEDRFVLLDFSRQSKMLVVCHCYKESEDIIRIISALKADKYECKQYEGFRNEK